MRCRNWFDLLAGAGWVVFGLVPIAWPVGTALQSAAAAATPMPNLARVAQLVANTLLLASAVSLVAMPAALVLAVVLVRLRLPCRAVGLWILLTGGLTPLSLYVGGWLATIGPYGIWRVSLVKEELGWPATVVVHAAAAVCWPSLLIGLALRLVDRELEEAGRLETNLASVFARISLPLCGSAIGFATALAVVPVLTDMSATDLFRIRTFAEEVYTEFESGAGPGMVTLWSLVLSVAGAVGICRLLRRSPIASTGTMGRAIQYRLDRSMLLLVALTGLVLLAFLTPIFGLIRQAGLETVPSAGSGLVVPRWSAPVCFTYLAQAGGSLKYAGHGLLNAGVVAVLTCVLATVLAWQWRQGGPLVRGAAVTFCVGLFLMPGPVLAIGLIELFNRPGIFGWLYDRPVVLIYAQTVRALPFGFAVSAAGFAMVSEDLLDASAMEGASRWQQLCRVALPIAWPAVLLAGAMAFAFALTELPATKLLAPPGTDTLVLRVFELLHIGTGNQQSALALLLVSLLMPIAGLVYLLARAAARRTADP